MRDRLMFHFGVGEASLLLLLILSSIYIYIFSSPFLLIANDR